MIDFESPDPHTIRMERLLDAPVETVWRYLTESDLRARWFAGGPIEPRVGGSLELVFDHDNLSSEDVPTPEQYKGVKGHRATETIETFDPPRRLAFTFSDQGTATFDLSPEGDRTRLVLTHSGITSATGRANFGGGWYSHLAVLQTILAGGSVPDFWALHAESQAKVKAALGG